MTARSLGRIPVQTPEDVAAVREMARDLAEVVGCPPRTGIALAIAVSEIARNAVGHGGGGHVGFSLDEEPRRRLVVQVTDQGPGLESPEQVLNAPGSEGLHAARRMVPSLELESAPGQGVTATLSVAVPGPAGPVDLDAVRRITGRRAPTSTMKELSQQNRELASALEELREREEDLQRTVRELEATNRGVLALHAELDERAEMLAAASDVKSRFMSVLSHEFRTPLSAVLSLSQLLLDRVDGELTEEQERQVSFIQSSAESLLGIANDLLDLAKVEAGRMTVRPERFEVETLFAVLRGTLRPLTRETEVALIFEAPPALPPLHTDEGKLNQILRNFITNALKFTEQGEVRVRAEGHGEDRIAFTVTDTGVGIAPVDLGRIFEPWTQLDAVPGRRRRGTGLGLPLTRRLAQLLGGDVTVESELGKGSTFRAVVPIAYRGPLEVELGSTGLH